MRTKTAIGLLILSATFAHGLLLFNGGVYWDGWKLYLANIAERWDLAYWLFSERGGIPIYTGLVWLLDQSPVFIFTYKAISFVSLLLTALCIFFLLQKFGLSAKTSFFVALIGMTYPNNEATVELIITPYLFSQGLFWLGWLGVAFGEEQSHTKHWIIRFISILCLILGFRLYSNLVLHFAVLVLYLLWRFYKKPKSHRAARFFLFTRFELVILPLIFFAIDQVGYPSRGTMVGVNSIQLNADSVQLFFYYLTVAGWETLLKSLVFVSSSPAVLLVLLLAGLFIAKRIGPQEDKSSAPILFAAGVFLLGASVLPYVINLREPAVYGWASRHTMLMGLPLSMCLVALVFSIPSNFSYLKTPLLTCFALAFIVTSIGIYLDWQVRWVRDLSVVENLPAQLASGSKADIEVIHVLDHYRVGREGRYRTFEWYGLLYLVDPDNPRIGLDAEYYSLPELLDNNLDFPGINEFLYLGVDLSGCQGVLTIQKAHSFSKAEMVARYFGYQFLRPNSLKSYLKSLTTLELERTAWTETNCPSFH